MTTRLVALSRFLPNNLSRAVLSTGSSMGVLPTFEAYSVPLEQAIDALCIPDMPLVEDKMNTFISAFSQYWQAMDDEVKMLQTQGCHKATKRMHHSVKRAYDIYAKLGVCMRTDAVPGSFLFENAHQNMEQFIQSIRLSAAKCAVKQVLANMREFATLDIPVRNQEEDIFPYLSRTLYTALSKARHVTHDKLDALVCIATYGNANCKELPEMPKTDLMKHAWYEMEETTEAYKDVQNFYESFHGRIINAGSMIQDCANPRLLGIKAGLDYGLMDKIMHPAAVAGMGGMAAQGDLFNEFAKSYLSNHLTDCELAPVALGVAAFWVIKKSIDAYRNPPEERIEKLMNLLDYGAISGTKIMGRRYVLSLFRTHRILETLKDATELTTWKGYKTHSSYPSFAIALKQIKMDREDISWKAHAFSKEFYTEWGKSLLKKYTEI